MKTVRFVLWLLWPPAVALGCLAAVGALARAWREAGGASPWWLPLLASAASVAVLVFAVWTLAHAFAALGKLRRRLGWHTKAERRAKQVKESYRLGIERGAQLRAHLTSGGQPAFRETWDVMLEPGEPVLFDAPMAYARWYATRAVYTHSPTIVVGRGPVVAGAGIGNLIGALVARTRTADAARLTWREHQTVRVVATDRRIICRTAGGWLNFWYRDVTSSHPDPAGSTLVLEFAGYEPLRLHGYDGAGLCVFATASLHGRNALLGHQGLASLPALPPGSSTVPQ